MRFAACLFVAFVCSGAFASQPGQPVDCSDWVVLEPGITCSVDIAYPCMGLLDPSLPPPLECVSMPGTGGDGDNSWFGWERIWLRYDHCGSDGQNSLFRNQLLRFGPSGQKTIIAYVDDRCGLPGYWDFSNASGPGFNERNGKLWIVMWNRCDTSCGGPTQPCGCAYSPGYTKIVLSGFTTLFEILQSYTPQASLGFRVPYMPEGMAAADHFDTYWGPLAHPLDFTQAHPLQCNYPAAAPHVGDYLTVADTVPTPVPGQGVYYVTAATYQGATRYGRKTTNHHLTGRDPALLPACVAPKPAARARDAEPSKRVAES